MPHPLSVRRRGLVATLLVALVACTPPPPEPPRTIVLVTIDTLRADHVEFLGYPARTTPFLSALAERSAVFREAYSAASHTTPSHASLLSSLYPDQHGAAENGQRFARGVETMASLLAGRGYRTAAFTSVGFLQGLDAGFDRFEAHERGASIYSPAHVTLGRARRWLAKQPPRRPAFVWVHLFDVHEWSTPIPEDREWLGDLRVESDLPAGERRDWLVREHGMDPEFYPTDEELHRAIDSYDRRILYVDEQLEAFFGEVAELGRGESALWIVTSDHGEGLGSHGYKGHGRYLWREQLRVPLLVHATDGLGAGLETDELARHVDLLPTLAELVGAPLGRTEGVSLLPLLTGTGELPPDRTAYAQRRPVTEQHLEWNWTPGELWTVFDTGHKYIESTTTDDWFFDLTRDPLEQVNLVDRPSTRREELEQTLRGYRRRFDRRRAKRGEIPEETRAELRDLGYAD